MYQVVIDTNVIVAALLSNRGASHRLLRLVGDPRWRINLSVPLVLEYEQTLKRVCTGGDLSGSDIDSVVGCQRRRQDGDRYKREKVGAMSQIVAGRVTIVGTILHFSQNSCHKPAP